MAFCSKCGTALPADVLFCPNCGAQREDEPARSEVVTDPDVAENKAVAVLCYVGPLFIVPLIAANTSPYVRFHLNNGLWLLICYAICACVPFVGWAADVVLLVFNIIGLVKCAQGKKEGLPILGKFVKFFH